MTAPYVTVSIENHIGTVEFFHRSHNAMPTQVLKDLEQAIKDVGENDEVKVVVLKSGGDRTFCAGASFEELKAISNEAEGKAFFSGFANVINAMRTCPKFIIGRVQGKAVGGGVGLIAATDYCLATQYAAVKLSELSIGIGPFVIAPVIERKVGVATLSELTINCTEFYKAQWAHEKGFYAQIFDTVEDLDVAVLQLATQLSSYNPEAMKAMKAALWEQSKHWYTLLSQRAETSGKLVLSTFTKTFLKNF